MFVFRLLEERVPSRIELEGFADLEQSQPLVGLAKLVR